MGGSCFSHGRWSVIEELALRVVEVWQAFHGKTAKAFQWHHEALLNSLQHRHAQVGVHSTGQIAVKEWCAEGVHTFEAERVVPTEEKRRRRKAMQLQQTTDPLTNDFTCPRCLWSGLLGLHQTFSPTKLTIYNNWSSNRRYRRNSK